MLIHIARHGQPDLNSHTEQPAGDPTLTPLGREQALRLGRRLKEEDFRGRIISSPYRRTVETADIIAEVLGSTFTVDARLREYTNPATIGRFRGMRAEELRERFRRVRGTERLAYPWWSLDRETPESPEELSERVGPMIETLIGQADGDVLLVGHGASTGACTRYLIGRSQLEAMNNGHTFWNCSLTSVRVAEHREPLYVHDVAHLPEDLITTNLKTWAEYWAEQKESVADRTE